VSFKTGILEAMPETKPVGKRNDQTQSALFLCVADLYVAEGDRSTLKALLG
jgi:hypothetical protein